MKRFSNLTKKIFCGETLNICIYCKLCQIKILKIVKTSQQRFQSRAAKCWALFAMHFQIHYFEKYKACFFYKTLFSFKKRSSSDKCEITSGLTRILPNILHKTGNILTDLNQERCDERIRNLTFNILTFILRSKCNEQLHSLTIRLTINQFCLTNSPQTLP